MTTYEHVLEGCRPVPLAHYLKALGVLRLVGEQADPDARGFWRRDRFVLRTALDAEGLERFFLEEYAPTPIVAPWNGGSGFYPKDNKAGVDAVRGSSTMRLESFRRTLDAASGVLGDLGIDEKVAKDDKLRLLEACRATLPDVALDWVDAAFLLTDDGAKYPPLLGTGGNDGRLDFTNNYMQRLTDVIDGAGRPTASATSLLEAALWDEVSEALEKAAIGQFFPSSAGGANGESGFEASALVNPWDFILMLEGAACFAAAAVRRMEHDTGGALSYPFTVRQSGVGYASSSDDDESSARAEMWLPLWDRPATHLEMRHLLSEGRARVGHRTARNGIDFARAIAGLGVDRGIASFQRYGFQVRNGLAYLAVPLNRFAVRAEPRAGLLQQIDGWLDSFRRRASATTAPAGARRALRQLESAILELCQHGDALRLQQVMVALGSCERVMARSRRWTEEVRLRPVPPLSPVWLSEVDDGSAELRLAAALASVHGRYKDPDGRTVTVPLRHQLEPVTTWVSDGRLRVRWEPGDSEVVFTSGHIVRGLNAVMNRRLVRAVQSGAESYPDRGAYWASLPDVADFIEGRVDEGRLTQLLWALCLLDWPRIGRDHHPTPRRERFPQPGAFYALTKLCFAGAQLPSTRTTAAGADGESASVLVPVVPRIQRLAASGRGADAALEAIRRLRGSGFGPALRSLDVHGEASVRTAAALLFPLGRRDLNSLAELVLRPGELEGGSGDAGPEGRQGATA